MGGDKSVLRHTQVGLIDIFDPICNYRVGDNEEIKFGDELALLWGIGVGVPLYMIPLLLVFNDRHFDRSVCGKELYKLVGSAG